MDIASIRPFWKAVLGYADEAGADGPEDALAETDRMGIGFAQTRLIVLRGNSGSGKSSVAKALREAYGHGVAWVSQDLIRRIILKEKDRPGGVNIGLIDHITRYSLDHRFHVVLDGILYADRYESMLAGLARDHLGVSRFYYLNVSIEETLRHHTLRPESADFSGDDMRQWYRRRDLLTTVEERVIPETSPLEQTMSLILAESELLRAPAYPASG